MDETITDTSVDDSGAGQALPDETIDTSAEIQTNEQGSDTTGGDNPLPEVDEKLKTWSESKGISLSSDNEIKLAKIAMDNQAEFQRVRSQKANVAEAMTVPDSDMSNPLEAEVKAIKNQLAVKEFFEKNPEAEAQRADIADYLNSNQRIQSLADAGYLNLEDVYTLFQKDTGVVSSMQDKARTEGGKDALQQLANKQQAVSVKGNATTSDFGSSVTPENFDSWYSGLSPAERADTKNQAIVSRMLS